MIVYGCFLVSFLYYFLPNQKKPFLPHIPGTVIVMLCWIGFTKLFNYYLSSFSQLSVIYGSIAGVIISLLGTMLVGIKDNNAKESEVMGALNKGNITSILVVAISSYFLFPIW